MIRDATTRVRVACLLVLLATAAATLLPGQTAPATQEAPATAPATSPATRPATGTERLPPPPPPGGAAWATPLLATGVAVLTVAVVLALARHHRHARGSRS